MKTWQIIISLLLVISFVDAQQAKIDDDNRVAVASMNKGSTLTFSFYGDSMSMTLKDFDFAHNRATIQIDPEEGTLVAYINTLTGKDFDEDGEDDLGITIISLDPNAGSSVNGEPGTAVIRLESLKPITLEETTVTTSVASTNDDNSGVETTAAAVAESDKISLGGSTIWIIVGVAVGVLVILFLLKDKIKVMFNKNAGMMAAQQGTPSNYKQGQGRQQAGSGMKCGKCGKDLNAGTKFCNNCGAKVVAAEKKKFCPECGTEYRGGKFCNNCGHKMM